MGADHSNGGENDDWECLAGGTTPKKYPRTAFYLMQEGLLRNRFKLEQPDIFDDDEPHTTQIACHPFNIRICHDEKPHIELLAHIDFEFNNRLAISQRKSTIQDEVRLWTESLMHNDTEHRRWLDSTIQGEEKAWQRNSMQILRAFKNTTVSSTPDFQNYIVPLRMGFQIQILVFVLGHEHEKRGSDHNMTAVELGEIQPRVPIVASEEFRRAVLPLLESYVMTLLQILCNTRGPYYRTTESFLIALFSIFMLLPVLAENKLDISSFEEMLVAAAKTVTLDMEEIGSTARSDCDLMVFLLSFLFVKMKSKKTRREFGVFRPVTKTEDFNRLRSQERDLFRGLRAEAQSGEFHLVLLIMFENIHADGSVSVVLTGDDPANNLVKAAMRSIFSWNTPL